MKSEKSHKRRFGHITIPLDRVHIELTNICNFDCTFCPKSEMDRPYGHMDVALAKRVIDELKSKKICDKITFHVMGEPTLHPKFFEILDYAIEKKMPVGLTTNGTGLNGKTGERLATFDLHQIDVSLQTPDEISFSLRKAKNMSFNEYIDGIFGFFSAYNVKEKNTIFKFRFLNTRLSSKKVGEKINHVSINSTNRELRQTFRYWAERVYDALEVDGDKRERALNEINKLVWYKWNVIEIFDKVFFETYLFSDWTDRSEDDNVRDAWAGYCFGLRDHFAILYNGNVVLCCIDFNGRTTVGNVDDTSLEEIFSSPGVGEIMDGFRKFRFVDPYCRKCQGSNSITGWLFKPLGYVVSLKILKPFFYNKTSVWKGV
jgi:MoaA/NifB/PqqE/SkfB family radical SAM enzyme